MRKILYLIIIGLSLALIGCDTQSASKAPSKKAPPTAPVSAPVSTLTEEAKASEQLSESDLRPGPNKIAPNGGLGDTFNVIQTAFGNPTRVNIAMEQGAGVYGYQNDKILVDFIESRAYHITYPETDLTMEQAQKLAKNMMPSDAKLIKQYTHDDQQFYVYQSQQLSTLFDSTWFENADGKAQPGYFDIAYLIDNGKVIAVDSFAGDNP